jgi:hypothetical protein
MENTKPKSPLKAIRMQCLECLGSSNEVKICTTPNCSLFAFRFGKNPYRIKRVLTDEQKKIMTERLKKARESKNSSFYGCDDRYNDRPGTEDGGINP